MKEDAPAGGSPARSGSHPTTAEWSTSEEHLRVWRELDRPSTEVERTLHLRPDELLRLAYGSADDQSGTATVKLSPVRSQSWLRVPALIDFWTPPPERSGAILSLRWRATRFPRYFPVLDAELVVRPLGENTTLELDGRYRPPLGFLGLLFDLLVGRRIAAAVATGFIETLGAAIERHDLPESA